jgi:hypothetical protein
VRAGDEEDGAVERVGGEVLGGLVPELYGGVRVVRDLAELEVVVELPFLQGAGQLDGADEGGAPGQKLPVGAGGGPGRQLPRHQQLEVEDEEVKEGTGGCVDHSAGGVNEGGGEVLSLGLVEEALRGKDWERGVVKLRLLITSDRCWDGWRGEGTVLSPS